jgi:hypothetical protein
MRGVEISNIVPIQELEHRVNALKEAITTENGGR